MAVVDEENAPFHGIDGLRVVDASVMPDIVSGNLKRTDADDCAKGGGLYSWSTAVIRVSHQVSFPGTSLFAATDEQFQAKTPTSRLLRSGRNIVFAFKYRLRGFTCR